MLLHMQPIDLRSDTVTRPSPGMREAMARAAVGDDVYGEDPTVRALEERVADLLGKESALFLPSGTMANQVAIGAQAGPGQEVICEAGAHVVAYEGGAVAALWGAQPRTLPGERGILTAEAIEAAIQEAGDDHLPTTSLICVENTHNRGGGSVWPLDRLDDVYALAARRAIPVHLDGARLWNAAAATGASLERLARGATTVSVCLSKGLGAPAGSLLAGPRSLAPRFRRLRKRLGGGMRQAGILAAAGLYALEHHLPTIEEDHQKARVLAEALGSLPGIEVEDAETNLVFARLEDSLSAPALVDALRAEGILVNAVGPRRLRLVTHRDLGNEDCLRAAETLAKILRQPPTGVARSESQASTRG